MKRVAIFAIFLLTATAARAQTFVQSWHTSDTASTDNFSCSSTTAIALPSATVTAGNLIAVEVGGLSTGTTQISVSSVTDNQSDTFAASVQLDHGEAWTEVWVAKAVTGGATTITVHLSAGAAAASCSIAIAGMEFGSTLGTADQHATSYSSNTAPATGLTPRTGNGYDLVLGAFSAAANSGTTAGPNDLSGSLDPNSGWQGLAAISVATRRLELVPAYAFATLRGQYGATWTTAASVTWYGAITAIVASNGGASGVLQSITLTPTNPTIQTGQLESFTATGNYSDSTTSDITNAVTWTSGTPGVATMSGNTATAVSVGSSVITATDPATSIAGTTTLHVAAPAPACSNPLIEPTGFGVTTATLLSVAVTPNPAMTTVGSAIPFTATGTYSDSSVQDVTGASTWSSSDLTKARMTGSRATALATGSVTITANDGGVIGTAPLTIAGATPTPNPGGNTGKPSSYWP